MPIHTQTLSGKWWGKASERARVMWSQEAQKKDLSTDFNAIHQLCTHTHTYIHEYIIYVYASVFCLLTGTFSTSALVNGNGNCKHYRRAGEQMPCWAQKKQAKIVTKKGRRGKWNILETSTTLMLMFENAVQTLAICYAWDQRKGTALHWNAVFMFPKIITVSKKYTQV